MVLREQRSQRFGQTSPVMNVRVLLNDVQDMLLIRGKTVNFPGNFTS